MGLFRKDFFRSLLVGFAIGAVGMGATMLSEAHAHPANPAPAAYAASAE